MIPVEELRAMAASRYYEVVETRRQTSDGVYYKLLVVAPDGGVFEDEVREGTAGARTPLEAWSTLVLHFVGWLGKPVKHRLFKALGKAAAP